MGLANSLALRITVVTSSMQDPIGRTISRNADGEPTGLMIDSALKVILSCIMQVSVEERRQALDLASSTNRGRRLSHWISIGGVKPFADGSPGSNNALFHEVEARM